MTEQYDQMKHRRGSSLPDQAMGHEVERIFHEWLKGLRSITPASSQVRMDPKDDKSTVRERRQPEEESRWQDDGGGSGA